ncbi:hypothetical protein ACJ73_02702 [Blastomyces percursus]|uniref:General negative regulator of transcription subunit n=1 Tax=Blastomyces percursus TaxID=1658174 RepID=A0A1J9QAQ4_9EURO|nr:hypothetical protein ACJ73_02702 [Blastomyces percursus]
MTSRKTQQEIDKTFKKVAEGIQSFEGIYDKIKSSSNAAQRDKLEDNLKREIKKLQRFRDQIKTWAAGNEVKDKGPLLEQRRAIETCMEQFKAVEKEMKTKAYSKEGLSAAARLDPKEKEKAETCDFLSSTVDTLQQKIEAMEAEEEMIQASLKKGKKDTGKTTRLSDITRILERHRWHVTKLELLLRCLQNGNVETSEVLDIKDSIKYFADDGHNADFCGEDETIYDDITLGDDEFGIPTDNDRVSSQDTQSIQDDDAEATRSKTKTDPGPARRPSTQMKSPLPVLATLHNGPSSVASSSMKPAPLPTRLPGETLKYASAAAAAAASDKSGVGIAPLPPPPGTTSSTASPQVHHAQPVQRLASAAPSVDGSASQQQAKSPTLSPSIPTSRPSTVPPTPATDNVETVPQQEHVATTTNGEPKEATAPPAAPTPAPAASPPPAQNDESVYHLPPGLQDLIQSFEITKSRVSVNSSTSVQRLLTASHHTCPEPGDAEKPRHYKPQTPYNTPLYYPQEALPIFDDPRLYETGRIDTDTLFYIFYYRQATYQQYLAAKSLKNQSWRFHKQYQTWFQRHEEPKTITEEFEQGTYRFFDYESTWMNRRKADFKFVYKFLEDDL